MKRWYLITVPVGLVTLAYLIIRLNSPSNFAELWSRDNQAKNTQSDVRKMPAVQAVPKDVLKRRQEHQLRSLTDLEAGTKMQDLPKGAEDLANLIGDQRALVFIRRFHPHAWKKM